MQGRCRQLRRRRARSRRCPRRLRIWRVVACPGHPPFKSPCPSRAGVGGARPGNGGARDTADRSRYTGDARAARPSPRMAVSDCGSQALPFGARFFFPPLLRSSLLLCFRDYYAALLRTHQSFVAPTQGKLLNYVQRVPLGVVAQITVRPSTG